MGHSLNIRGKDAVKKLNCIIKMVMSFCGQMRSYRPEVSTLRRHPRWNYKIESTPSLYTLPSKQFKARLLLFPGAVLSRKPIASS